MTVQATFFDTSLFLSGVIEIDENDPGQLVMDALSEGELGRPKTAWHCCLEFYSVSTRLPEGLRIAPADAGRIVEEEIMARCEVLDLPKTHRLQLLRWAKDNQIAGGRIYDAHIAEVARASGAKLVVSDNRRHFTSLLRHGIQVLTVREYSEELKL